MKKKCIKCGKEKDISEFYKNYGNKDFHSNICKSCVAKTNKDWNEKNKEKRKKLNQDYYLRKKALYNENKTETITFYIESELKKQFLIKLSQEKLSIVEKLNELIREYIK